MNNLNQNTSEAVQSVDTVARDFVAAAMTVSVTANLVLFVSWLAISVS